VWNSKRAGKANWYGQLVALAQCRLGGGRAVDVALVRWNEAAPTRTATAAVAARCPCLHLVLNTGWCSAASVHHYETLVTFRTDIAVSWDTIMCVNKYLRLIRPRSNDAEDQQDSLASAMRVTRWGGAGGPQGGG
jgi:hypothetical protein